MSLSNAAENDLLLLMFNNTAWANVGSAGGLQPSSAAGSFFISLHTADPGETGTQTTSEAAYTSYARVAVARSGAGWTVSGTAPTQVVNAATITFPTPGSSGEVETYFAIGRDTSGAGEIIVSGALAQSYTIANGTPPVFPIGTLKATAD